MKRTNAAQILEVQTALHRAQQKVCTLIPLQSELHMVCHLEYKKYRDRNGKKPVNGKNKNTVTQFAIHCGSTENCVRAIYKRTSVVTKGEGLKAFCKAVNRMDLYEKLVEVTTNLKGGYISLAAYTEETVNRIFVLLEAHAVHFYGLVSNMGLASVFGEDLQDTVYNAMNLRREALIEISKPEIANRVDEILTHPNFSRKIKQRIAEIKAARMEKSAELAVLLERMKLHITMVKDRAKALGITTTAYHGALKGRVPKSRIEEVIEKAENYLESINDSIIALKPTVQEITEPEFKPESELEPKPEPAKPEPQNDESFTMPVMGPVKRKKKTSSRPTRSNGDFRAKQPARPPRKRKPAQVLPLEKVGGGTSPTGVELCLTKSGFASLDIKPSKGLIENLKQYIQITRGLLNMCSQIKNDNIRANVREDLELEIAELELAIRQFAHEYPGKLCDLFDSSRQHLAKQSESEQVHE